MTKEEFIKKWNIAFEDKEQELEFAAEMESDLDAVTETLRQGEQFTALYQWMCDNDIQPLRKLQGS
jgi:hypothetical protein